MRSRIIFIFTGSVVILTVVFLWIIDAGYAHKKSEQVVVLKVDSGKQEYILGETVKLRFRVLNGSDQAVRFTYRPDVSTGYLKVWISSDGREYKLYNNTYWGRREGGGITLNAGGSFESEATILWNSKPDAQVLTPELARERIISDFAFPSAGIYFIKAVLSFPGNKRPKIESEPLQVVFREAVGDDLEIWKSIKDNKEFAHFLQNGGFLTSRDEERDKLAEHVKQIARTYPNGILADQIQQSLENFQRIEMKRRELLEKANATPRN